MDPVKVMPRRWCLVLAPSLDLLMPIHATATSLLPLRVPRVKIKRVMV
jgi:hypothetical protein